MYWSTAFGSSRDSRARSSSRESPVFCERSAITSGPIARSRSVGATDLFGPVPTQEIGNLALPGLLEAVDELTKPAAEETPDARALELFEQPSETTLLAALLAGRGTARAPLPGAAEHFGELVAVLVAGDRQEAQ